MKNQPPRGLIESFVREVVAIGSVEPLRACHPFRGAGPDFAAFINQFVETSTGVFNGDEFSVDLG